MVAVRGWFAGVNGFRRKMMGEEEIGGGFADAVAMVGDWCSSGSETAAAACPDAAVVASWPASWRKVERKRGEDRGQYSGLKIAEMGCDGLCPVAGDDMEEEMGLADAFGREGTRD
ncbi:hypothetical protein HAX54_016193 [Datura stramonium]|uniref:Uncharacterized protein n=1 Tax=Datura stramonium TaxID=4076 RepID=A0ABS8UKP7_DATST|nr:hypothetical protein [Datura stramonium]